VDVGASVGVGVGLLLLLLAYYIIVNPHFCCCWRIVVLLLVSIGGFLVVLLSFELLVHCCNCQIFGFCFCLVYECHCLLVVVVVVCGGQSLLAVFMFIVGVVYDYNVDILDVVLV